MLYIYLCHILKEWFALRFLTTFARKIILFKSPICARIINQTNQGRSIYVLHDLYDTTDVPFNIIDKL